MLREIIKKMTFPVNWRTRRRQSAPPHRHPVLEMWVPLGFSSPKSCGKCRDSLERAMRSWDHLDSTGDWSRSRPLRKLCKERWADTKTRESCSCACRASLVSCFAYETRRLPLCSSPLFSPSLPTLRTEPSIRLRPGSSEGAYNPTPCVFFCDVVAPEDGVWSSHTSEFSKFPSITDFSNFIPLWLKNIFCMISILLNSLRLLFMG